MFVDTSCGVATKFAFAALILVLSSSSVYVWVSAVDYSFKVAPRERNQGTTSLEIFGATSHWRIDDCQRTPARKSWFH
jgi:hypothetical protein